jgi:hypothetical protein
MADSRSPAWLVRAAEDEAALAGTGGIAATALWQAVHLRTGWDIDASVQRYIARKFIQDAKGRVLGADKSTPLNVDEIGDAGIGGSFVV